MSIIAAVAGLSIAMQTGGVQLGVPNLPSAPKMDQTLVKVNGFEIKAKDINDLLWDSKAEEILNEVMYYQLAKVEADKSGVFLTGKEIDEGVARELDSMRASLQQGQTLEEFMAASGQTKPRLYLAVKTSLLLTKIAFIDFDPSAYVKVSTIILKPASNSAADVSAAIKTVQGAYDRLTKGEPWEKLVDEIIIDEDGRRTRGVLGWRQIVAFPEDVKSELTTLKAGSYTKPVQTPNGIQMFRIDASGKSLNLAEKEQMRIDLTDSLRVQAVNKIRKNVKIERLWPESAKKPGSAGV